MKYWNGVIGGFGGAIISMWVSNREAAFGLGAFIVFKALFSSPQT